MYIYFNRKRYRIRCQISLAKCIGHFLGSFKRIVDVSFSKKLIHVTQIRLSNRMYFPLWWCDMISMFYDMWFIKSVHLWKLLHNHSKPAVFLKKKFKVNQPTQSICSFYVKNFLDVWRTLKELRLQNLLICCDNLAMTKFFEKKRLVKKYICTLVVLII